MKKNGLEKEVVILVLELAVGGELFDFMMYTGAFPEIIARTYFLQVSLFFFIRIVQSRQQPTVNSTEPVDVKLVDYVNNLFSEMVRNQYRRGVVS